MKHALQIVHRQLQTEQGIVVVDQRPDGYINLTQMCQAAEKPVHNWLRTQDTQEYLEELAATTHIRVVDLVYTVTDAPVGQRHTWGHPRVALKCAAWCSKQFEVQVYEWIETLRTQGVVDVRQHGDALKNALNAIGVVLQQNTQEIGQHTRRLENHEARIEHVEHAIIQFPHQLNEERVARLRYQQQQERQRNARRNYFKQVRFPQYVIARFLELWSGRDCMFPGCQETDIIRRRCFQYDHVLPSSKEGPNDITNIGLICKWTNMEKRDQLLPDYRPIWLIERLKEQAAEWAREDAQKEEEQRRQQRWDFGQP